MITYQVTGVDAHHAMLLFIDPQASQPEQLHYIFVKLPTDLFYSCLCVCIESSKADSRAACMQAFLVLFFFFF